MSNPEVAPQQAAPYAPQPALPTTLAYTNTFALVSILSAFVAPIAAIIFGHLALGQIKRNGDTGRGLALTGLVIGYAYFAAIAMFIVFYLSIIGIVFASMGSLAGGASEFGPY